MKFKAEGLYVLGSAIFVGLILGIGVLAVVLLPTEGPRPTVPNARHDR